MARKRADEKKNNNKKRLCAHLKYMRDDKVNCKKKEEVENYLFITTFFFFSFVSFSFFFLCIIFSTHTQTFVRALLNL